MRFGQRSVLVILVVMALFAGACSGDDDDDDAATEPESTTTTAFDEAAAESDINDAFEQFFNGKVADPDQHLAVLEDGDDPDVEKLYLATSNDPQFADALKNTSADTDTITLKGETKADVSFFLVAIDTGDRLLPDAIQGSAVREGDDWKVSRATFCDIAALGNPAAADDPACSDVAG
jgi:hypothetical protein